MTSDKSPIFALMCIQAAIFLWISSANGGLGVIGALIEMNVTPGDHINKSIKVQTDPGDLPMDILVDIKGYGQSPHGGCLEIAPEDDKSQYTARPFIRISPSSFRLESGGEQIVTLEGDISTDVGVGGRYAIINIHSLPIGTGTVGICLAINVPVRLTISGTDQIKSGEIESLTLEASGSKSQQNITLIFKNTGNCHYPIMVNASLEDEKGMVLASASEPPSSNIIPGCLRTVELYLRPAAILDQGKYVINATASLEDGTALSRKEAIFNI